MQYVSHCGCTGQSETATWWWRKPIIVNTCNDLPNIQLEMYCKFTLICRVKILCIVCSGHSRPFLNLCKYYYRNKPISMLKFCKLLKIFTVGLLWKASKVRPPVGIKKSFWLYRNKNFLRLSKYSYLFSQEKYTCSRTTWWENTGRWKHDVIEGRGDGEIIVL